MSYLQVLICDDHRMMREALAGYLAAQPAIATVAAVGDVDSAVRRARTGCDVLVLDLRLANGESGLEALEAMQNLGIAVPVLVMSGPGDLELPARALTLGALGYCPKTAEPQELYHAVLDVASGRAFIPDDVLEPILRRLLDETQATAAARALYAALTPREAEVLRLLVQGVQRREIAKRLAVSANTVRTHLRHLMDKLGVTSQLAAAARGRQLLEAVDRPRAAAADTPAGRVIDLVSRERVRRSSQ